ncbi:MULTISPECIES: DUF4328 domain-containing protein [unclassified Kitasatospora]|uniref:DUF4328 domain-containing protein n=1 Tax=unclassified Kitasatospora TaxID=2633591 RepID=UPI0033D7EC20
MATQVLLAMQAVVQVILGLNSWTGSRFLAQAAALLSMPVFLGTIVVFLCWLRRCRLNAEAFAPGTHKYTVGGAVGVWFIPVVMWWAPRRVVVDLWRAGGSTGGAWVIDAWWVAWIAKSVGVTAYMVIDLQGNPNAPLVVLVDVVAVILAILLVGRITATQSAKIKA